MTETHLLHIFMCRCKLLYPPGDELRILVVLHPDKTAKESIIFLFLTFVEAPDDGIILAIL